MITEKMAHAIMGAFEVSESEGITGCADNVFSDCNDHHENEVNVVRMLYQLHPNVVTNPEYSHLDSVKEVVK